MSYFIDICLLCFNNSNDLKLINCQNTFDKLKYVLPEQDLISEIPNYICNKCENNLNNFYEFKQKCLQNMTAYEKYAQQITTTDSSCKNLSVDINVINPVFIDKKDETKIEEIIIKQEINEEFDIKEEIEEQVDKLDFKKQVCEICHKSVKYLKVHKQTHTNERPFSCEICNQSFKQLTHLNTHRLTHSGEKPYKCEVCDKSFRTSTAVKNHKLLHTGEKPFTCDICSKSFRQASGLKSHKLLHTGEKPYSCGVCNKLFRLSHHLKQHSLTHPKTVYL